MILKNVLNLINNVIKHECARCNSIKSVIKSPYFIAKCSFNSNIEQNINTTKDDEKINKKIKIKKGNKKIIKYLESINPQFIHSIPRSLQSETIKNSDGLYIINPETAKKFTELIINDLKDATYIAEANPGFGVLTRELLNAGIPQINVFEQNKVFHNILNNLNEDYSGRITINPCNIFLTEQMWSQDMMDSKGRIENIISNLETKEWEDTPTMHLIGGLLNIRYIKHILLCTIYQNCIMQKGRINFYLAIPPSLWHVLIASNESYKWYTTRTVMFQLLFNYQLLGTLDRISFLPWHRAKQLLKNDSISHKRKLDAEVLYVVKLEPKSNIFTDIFEKQELIIFWHFVRHNLFARSSRIIPELEKMAPGCGVSFIAEGYNIYTEFGDLSPTQMVQLFKTFFSLPNFNKNEYLSCMEIKNFQMKKVIETTNIDNQKKGRDENFD